MPCLFRHFGASFAKSLLEFRLTSAPDNPPIVHCAVFAAMTEIASAFLRGNGYRGLLVLRNSLELQLRARDGRPQGAFSKPDAGAPPPSAHPSYPYLGSEPKHWLRWFSLSLTATLTRLLRARLAAVERTRQKVCGGLRLNYADGATAILAVRCAHAEKKERGNAFDL
ncbi:hypothetical protein GGE12_003382 [Rhizobium mongolense]|uniref:Uncharacterized protein n=1 Tax=Rhizobium mongolense TaxID=57676 RepID=A0A7W6RNA0_9HYPH|nr:hypothetical protein [Rhizobium mongolense]